MTPIKPERPMYPVKLSKADWAALESLLSKGVKQGTPPDVADTPEELKGYVDHYAQALIGYLRHEAAAEKDVIEIHSAPDSHRMPARDLALIMERDARDTKYALANKRRTLMNIMVDLRNYALRLAEENNVVPDPPRKRWYRVYHGKHRTPSTVSLLKILKEIDAEIDRIRAAREIKPDGEIYCGANCGHILTIPGTEFCPDNTRADARDGGDRRGSCYDQFHKQLTRWREIADRKSAAQKR